MERTERVALITGASQGLGAELATFLGGQGCHLVITARSADALKAQAGALAALNVKVTALPGDVANPKHRAKLVEAAAAMGRLDILINNASDLGPIPMPALADYDLDALRHVFEVNFIGPVALVQEALPLLKESHGLVVNLSSDAARGGYDNWGGYGASKAALDLASKTFASELEDEGVAVISVDPGDMRTAMHQDAFLGEDISDLPLPDITLPFWAWALGQDPASISGRRFQAQEDLWETQS
jgi:NAD(P)-dependent dehydrogenase (short-subunit alcohol dehydrogenase family)